MFAPLQPKEQYFAAVGQPWRTVRRARTAGASCGTRGLEPAAYP